MKYRRDNLIDVPEEYKNIRQAVLNDINDIYVILETGKIWSRAAGKFVNSYPNKSGVRTTVLTKKDGGTIDTSIQLLMRKYFDFDEVFKDVEYKPVLGLEDKYLALADGRIYSLVQHRILKESKSQSGWKMVCLVDNTGKRFTAFPAKLVYEAFNGPLEKGYIVTFKDGDKNNTNINNLDSKFRFKKPKEKKK